MKISICTRGSALALAQTQLVSEALSEKGYIAVPEVISTQGDQKQGTKRAGEGDKRDWIHELEVSVGSGESDVAIHSGKDIPAEIDNRTVLIPVLERSEAADYFIGKKRSNGTRITIAGLKAGDIVGTASLRRQAAFLNLKEGIETIAVRGNVPTRLQKLEDSDDLSGIVLAGAGLKRLNLMEHDFERLDPEAFCPAVNQGILVAQIRNDRPEVINALRGLVHPATEKIFLVERRCVEVLEGDCHTAMGVHCEHQGENRYSCRAVVYAPDGRIACEAIRSTTLGESEDATAFGSEIAALLIEQGATAIIEACREQKLKPVEKY